MSSNVTPLPRPKTMRTTLGDLDFYVRVGHNDHLELPQLLASGERGVLDLGIDARTPAADESKKMGGQG